MTEELEVLLNVARQPVKDTPAGLDRKFRRLLLSRSGEERLKMGCSMHATARKLAQASLLQEHPGARPNRQRLWYKKRLVEAKKVWIDGRS